MSTVTYPSARHRVFLLDCETTGLYASCDRIAEVAIQLYEPGQCIDSMRPLSVLVNPGVPCRPAASAIHGLTDEVLAEALPFPNVWVRIAAYVRAWCADDEQAVIVAHNAQFDGSFLCAELERHGIESPEWLVACSLELARSLWPRKPARLEDLAHRAGVDDTSSAHRAAADVKMLSKVLDSMDGALSTASLDVRAVLADSAVPLQSDFSRISTPKLSLPATDEVGDTRPTSTSVSLPRLNLKYEMVNESALVVSSSGLELLQNSKSAGTRNSMKQSAVVEVDDNAVEHEPTNSSAATTGKKNTRKRRSKHKDSKVPNQGWVHTRHESTANASPPRSAVKKIPDVLTDSSTSVAPGTRPNPVSQSSIHTKKSSVKNKASSQKTETPVPDIEDESRTILYTKTGKCYHYERDCAGLATASSVLEGLYSAAPRRLRPCTLCGLGNKSTKSKSAYSSPTGIQDYVGTIFEIPPEKTADYYHTRKGSKFHVTRDCYGLRNAAKHNLIAVDEKPEHLEPCKVCVLKLNFQFV